MGLFVLSMLIYCSINNFYACLPYTMHSKSKAFAMALVYSCSSVSNALSFSSTLAFLMDVSWAHQTLKSLDFGDLGMD